MEGANSSRLRLWLTADVSAHAAVLFWLLFAQPAPAPQTRAAGANVTIFDVRDASAPAASVGHPAASLVPKPPDALPAPLSASARQAPPPSLEQQVAAIIGDRAIDALALPADRPSTGLISSGCDLTGTVQAALQADPDAAMSIARLPPATLSIANAFMLWDGDWVTPRVVSDSTNLDVVHDVIVAKLSAASAECRNQEQIGPRLIAFGSGPDSITLVVGSGVWKWGDLVKPDMQSNIDRQSILRSAG